MQASLIGQVLCQMGIMTSQDVDRVLAHQAVTRQKFGQIAVRWGLATQEQIWEAWARQLAQRERFDLDVIGSDTAAWQCVPLIEAATLGIVPLRLWGSHLVIAASADLDPGGVRRLERQTGCTVHVCRADRQSVKRHLAAQTSSAAA